MKKVLAISGGVDSMVMLDIMCKVERLTIVEQWCELEHYGCTRPRLIVATFDHRARESSAEDAEFVLRSTRGSHVPYALGRRVEAGPIAEAEARAMRYRFLWAQAKKLQDPNNLMVVREDYNAERIPLTDEEAGIYTAHHLDDLVETVAINLMRGTGWRGLAVLDAPGVKRPFLEPELLTYTTINGEAGIFAEPFDKQRILLYAAKKRIVFRQDPTNTSEQYLRNRVRTRLLNFTAKMELYRLWQRQKKLKREIDEVISQLLPAEGEPWERNWFWELAKQKGGEQIALELLRAGLLRCGVKATRPQLRRFWQAILSYAPGKYYNLPNDNLVKIGKEVFWLDL